MANNGGINGTAIFALLVGSVLAYSGLKGKHISAVFRSLIEGKNPTDVPQSNPIFDPASYDTATGDVGNSSLGNIGSLGTIGGGSGDYKGSDWATHSFANDPNSTLSLKQIGSLWIQAGGPTSVAPIAAAITVPEAGRRPGAVQPGQPYATTGWGLWQITPGNSEPQFGTDTAMLTPMNNAKAAVAKFQGAGGKFTPWTTYTSGKYLSSLSAAQQALGS